MSARPELQPSRPSRRRSRRRAAAAALAVATTSVLPGFLGPARAASSGSLPCPHGSCVQLDATATVEPALRPAQGFLHSLDSSGNAPSYFSQLDPSMWRSYMQSSSGGVTPVINACSRWNIATGDGTPTTLLLSDDWHQWTSGNQTPWANWSKYESWLRSTITQIRISSCKPTYYEVYNEPDDLRGYYSAASYATVTPALLLQQFLVTYQVIKKLDPTAQVIGPSTAGWSLTDTSKSFGMTTFLDYAAANGVQLAALTWHANGGPAGITAQVAQARSLIAARPGLGQPKIFINEYGAAPLQRIPGWDVAYLSALTAAQVDSADRSCWDDDCSVPALDGLLTADGNSTLPDYWVRYTYARMTGNMISSTTSTSSVTGVGSYNAATGTVLLLVGRGVGCTQDPRCSTQLRWKDAPAGLVTVTVLVPWVGGSVHVEETRIPGGNIGPTAQPRVVFSGRVAVGAARGGKGLVTMRIPAFADGDAYGFLITYP